MNTSHSQFAIVEYLRQHPGNYIHLKDLQLRILKKAEHCKTFIYAIMDLVASGQIVRVGDKVKITQ